MYTTEKYKKEIPVKEYLEKYVNIEEFLEYCKECPNYGAIWSCPPYDFNQKEYWGKYKTLEILGVKINFDEDLSEDEGMEIMHKVKDEISAELFREEKKYPGSISLSAGSCTTCGQNGCTRKTGAPCCHSDKMRYSIESLGGNVGKTVHDLLKIDLEWLEEGILPSYFVLVGGILKK